MKGNDNGQRVDNPGEEQVKGRKKDVLQLGPLKIEDQGCEYLKEAGDQLEIDKDHAHHDSMVDPLIVADT